jgi:hypothetical protein
MQNASMSEDISKLADLMEVELKRIKRSTIKTQMPTSMDGR